MLPYTFQALSPLDPYSPHWVRLRWRARAENGVALIVLGVMGYDLVCGGSPLPALLLSLVAFLGAGWYRRRWPCPRCGRPFYWSGLIEFAPRFIRCPHCGLPEYAPNADAGSDVAPLPSCSTKSNP